MKPDPQEGMPCLVLYSWPKILDWGSHRLKVEPGIVILLNNRAVNMPPRYLCLYRPVLLSLYKHCSHWLLQCEAVSHPCWSWDTECTTLDRTSILFSVTHYQGSENTVEEETENEQSCRIGRSSLNMYIPLMKSQQQWLPKQDLRKINHSLAPLITEELLAIGSCGGLWWGWRNTDLLPGCHW